MMSSRVSESPAKYGRDPRISDDDEPWLEKKFWTESEYLALETNHLIEFNNGVLEILPMPNILHQRMALFFANLLNVFFNSNQAALAVCAPFRMKVPNGKYREPDVLFLRRENMAWYGPDYWTGADLVLEIISPGGRKRDEVDKRADYAATGIAEYWLVDPEANAVTVLKLDGATYIEHGIFKSGERATSALLSGFGVDVDALFALREPFGK